MNMDMIYRHDIARAVVRSAGVMVLAMALLWNMSALAMVAEAVSVGLEITFNGSKGDASRTSREIAFVQRFGDTIVELMRRDLSHLTRREQLRKFLVEDFDLNAAGRTVLGRYWRTATDAQLARYRVVYPEYVLAIFDRLFDNYSGESLRVKHRQPLGGGHILIEATFDRPAASPIRVVFRVRNTGAGFKVLDILVERISILVAQRSEFASIIGIEGIDGLLSHLEKEARRASSQL